MNALATLRDVVGRVYYNVLYRLEDSPVHASVGDATARFDVSESESDYFHVRMLAHERPILQDFLRTLQPSDVFWDVGAKIGLYSWLAADALGPGGRVIAFEPTPSRGVRWRANQRVNDAACTAVLYETALADAPGEAEMAEGNISPGAVDLPAGAERFTATLRRGDSLVAADGVPAPDVMKVDTEGFEHQVLRGLSGTFRRDPPRRVYVETHDKMARFGGDAGDVHDFMAAHGYESKYIESEYPQGNTAHYVFWRP